MKTVLYAVLLLVPLAGCAIAPETEQTGSSNEALMPVEHTILSKPKISIAPIGGAVAHTGVIGSDVPEPPDPPGGPAQGFGGGVSVPEPAPAPGGPVER